MKKLTTISLFIFGIIITAILTAGLVFYQNKKDNQVADNKNTVASQELINQVTSSGKTLILNMAEINKHNKQSDCWLLIDSKVYNITSYFGSHPGGNSTMSATCGKDATAAYATQNPQATSSPSRSAHSANAKNMLSDYYIGDFNQTIGVQNQKNNIVTSPNIQSPKPKITNPDLSPVVIPPTIPIAGNLTLDMTEITKHNKSSDCWLLINGKVYNITSYFGSHPGGNSQMSATCGEDATAEYATKNSSATTSSGRSAHSSNAVSLLANYYIGDLNQVIGEQKITQTNAVVPPPSGGDDYEGEEDDD
jgi:cytochrome b involved in lipid metabolism